VGRFKTSYFKGFVPVAAIVKRNGEPGLTPNTFVPLILGSGFGFGVRIIFASCENAIGNPVNTKRIRNSNLAFMSVGFI
jgi:hypothetical protein